MLAIGQPLGAHAFSVESELSESLFCIDVAAGGIDTSLRLLPTPAVAAV